MLRVQKPMKLKYNSKPFLSPFISFPCLLIFFFIFRYISEYDARTVPDRQYRPVLAIEDLFQRTRHNLLRTAMRNWWITTATYIDAAHRRDIALRYNNNPTDKEAYQLALENPYGKSAPPSLTIHFYCF